MIIHQNDISCNFLCLAFLKTNLVSSSLNSFSTTFKSFMHEFDILYVCFRSAKNQKKSLTKNDLVILQRRQQKGNDFKICD